MRGLLRFLRRRRSAALGAALLVVLVSAVAGAPLLAPVSPFLPDVRHMLQPPSASHPLGTDQFGRDVLSRALFGGRATLAIGVFVVGLAFVSGGFAGTLAGFAGGWIDAAIMRCADAVLSFPALVLAIALAAAFGSGPLAAASAIAFAMAPQFARVARAQASGQMAAPHVEAARAAGIPQGTILVQYVLRNGAGPLLTQVPLLIGSAILQTASLGFLGLRAQPPRAEWGADIAANLDVAGGAAWVVAVPGVAILLTVLGFNLVGDALRAWLDPRLRDD